MIATHHGQVSQVRMEEGLSPSGLAAMAGEGSNIFAVIDPNLMSDLHDLLAEEQLEYAVLCHTTPPVELIGSLPHLVALPWESHLLCRFLDDCGKGVGVLVSSQNSGALNDIAGHLKNFCVAADSNGKNFWLRFYEPYVLHTLLEISDAEQYACLFGMAIDSFIMEDAYSGVYYRFMRGEKRSSRGNYTLSAAQFDALNVGHYRLFCAEIYAALKNEHILGTDRTMDLQRIERHIEAAEGFGFYSMQHIFRFIRLACVHGWDFYTQPRFTAVLSAYGVFAGKRLEQLEALADNDARG